MKLNKRYARSIRSNLSFYVSASVLTMVGLLLFYLFYVAGTGIGRYGDEFFSRNHREDASFTTMQEISDDDISELEKKFISSLPFSLTKDQVSSLNEIRQDLDTQRSMNRLLQGDVGSGKTLIAWISSLHEIAKKGQVAFMAPTELLARQHA